MKILMHGECIYLCSSLARSFTIFYILFTSERCAVAGGVVVCLAACVFFVGILFYRSPGYVFISICALSHTESAHTKYLHVV